MLLDKLRNEYHNSLKNRERSIPKLQIEEQEFVDEIRAHGCILLAKRGVDKTFEYDGEILNIAKQLYYFTIRDIERFDGDLNKGIALVGYYGCGKTLLFESWSELIKFRVSELGLNSNFYQFYTSQELHKKVLEDTTGTLYKVPMIIDELGRESKVAKSWGNESSPIPDLLIERYRNGSITHITANFTLEALSDENMYGKMIGDRFKEMFNFIKMHGGSRR